MSSLFPFLIFFQRLCIFAVLLCKIHLFHPVTQSFPIDFHLFSPTIHFSEITRMWQRVKIGILSKLLFQLHLWRKYIYQIAKISFYFFCYLGNLKSTGTFIIFSISRYQVREKQILVSFIQYIRILKFSINLQLSQTFAKFLSVSKSFLFSSIPWAYLKYLTSSLFTVPFEIISAIALK